MEKETDTDMEVIESDVEATDDGEAGDTKIDPMEGFTGETITNPVKAIRAKCLECSNGMTSEIRRCLITTCVLYPFRMGKNPHRTRELTDEQRAAFVERGKKMGAIRAQKLAEKKAEEQAKLPPPRKLRV